MKRAVQFFHFLKLRFFKLSLFSLALIHCPAVLSAKEAALSINAGVNKQRVTIGEELRYTVTLSHPSHVEVIKPDPFRNFGALTLSDYQLVPTRHRQNTDGTATAVYTIHYMLRAYQTGTVTIPPVEAIILTPASTQTDSHISQITLSSQPITLTVTSLLTTSEEQAQPFKPPYKLAGKPSVQAIAAILVGCLLFGGVFLLWRRRRQHRVFVRAEAPFYEVAWVQLETLLTSHAQTLAATKKTAAHPNTHNHLAEFYAKLSQIARTYLSAKLGNHKLLAATTPELRRMLPTYPPQTLTKTELRVFIAFFTKADQIKFSGKSIPPHYATTFVKKFKAQLVEELALAANMPTNKSTAAPRPA